MTGTGDPEARRLAILKAMGAPAREVRDLVLRALADEDWRVRKEAVAVAIQVEPRHEVVAGLVEALGDGHNVGLRNGAMEALAALGTDAVPALLGALPAFDADGRKLVLEALAAIPDERAVGALVAGLADDDANVRVTAAEGLREAGRAGVEIVEGVERALVDALEREDTHLRFAALGSLARLGADVPWSILAGLWHDEVLRRSVVAATASCSDPRAADALADAAGEPSPAVAGEALRALATRRLAGDGAPWASRLRRLPLVHQRVRDLASPRGARDEGARAMALVLLPVFADPADADLAVEALGDEGLATYAEGALRALGEGSVGPLLGVLAEGTSSRKVRALEILGDVGSTAAVRGAGRALLAAADDGAVAAVALRVLGRRGASDDLELAARFALHADPRVAGAARDALGTLAARDLARARDLVVGVDPERAEAQVACVVLAALGAAGGDEAEGFLLRVLGSGDGRARRLAVDALAARGSTTGSNAGAEAVALALSDEEHDVREAAVRALGVLGHLEPLVALVAPRSARSPSQAAAMPRDPSLVAAALRALGDVDPEATFEVARTLVRGPDAALATAAVEALGRLPSPRHREALFDALEHPDAEVVKAALVEVAALLDARAIARVGTCLDHPAWEVRRLACELLGAPPVEGKDGHSLRALLRSRLEREKDPEVRRALTEALGPRPSLFGSLPPKALATSSPEEP